MSNPEKRKGFGCIGKGCAVMVLLSAVFIGVLWWYSWRITATLRAHASTSAIAVPADNGTQDEYEALVGRLDDFRQAPPGGGKTLELTAHDLNLLIAFSPEWKYVRGKIRASIDDDEIALNGSIPLDFDPSLRGRYWNGAIHFTMSIDDRGMHASVQDIKLEGSGLSANELKTISTLGTVYLTSYALPVLGPVLMKAKTARVKGGVITLTPE